MVFVLYLIRLDALYYIEQRFLWKRFSLMLNRFLGSLVCYDRIYSDDFPRESKNLSHLNENLPRPLPEDFVLRGLLFVDRYYLLDWFSNDNTDNDEKYFELVSMIDIQKERIL